MNLSSALRTIKFAALGATLVLVASAHAQDLLKKAPPQSEPIVIENATVHTVSGEVISGGFVYFNKGVIEAVGKAPLPRFATQVKIIDGTGKHVYPGLIAAYSQIGLIEIAAVRASLDMGEIGVGTPEARAGVAVNPDSTLIPVTRSNGVLVAGVFPRTNSTGQLAYFAGPGGLFPGRPSVMRLEGWTWEDMTVLADAGLVINWPFPRVIDAWWMNKSREDQQKDLDQSLRTIDDLITQGKAYAAAKGVDPSLPTDIRFEAMRGIFARGDAQKPVFVEAQEFDAIHQAVALCVRHGLKCVIIGGRDAELCADLLKRHQVSVIIEGTHRFPRRDDSPYDEAYTLPARLEAAGVTWCLSSGEEAANERNLPYAAAMAVAHGLDPKSALESITIRAARVLGVDKQLGSLEHGKSATLFIADEDVLEVTTNVSRAFIDGRDIDLTDKHKVLADKYREKYRQMGSAGQAPAAAPATIPVAPPSPAPATPAPAVKPAPAPTRPSDEKTPESKP